MRLPTGPMKEAASVVSCAAGDQSAAQLEPDSGKAVAAGAAPMPRRRSPSSRPTSPPAAGRIAADGGSAVGVGTDVGVPADVDALLSVTLGEFGTTTCAPAGRPRSWPYGIRVNALVPGLIATNPDEPAESRRRPLRDRHPAGGRRRCAGAAAQPAGRDVPGERVP